VEHQKAQANWGIRVEQEYEVLKDLNNGDRLRISENVEDTREVDCKAKPAQIKGEKMKLP
jgi:hypothetical protein